MSLPAESTNGISVEKSRSMRDHLSHEDTLYIIRREEAERKRQFWKNLPDWVKVISFAISIVVTISTFYYGTKSSIDILRLKQEQTGKIIAILRSNQREIAKQQQVNRELLIEIRTELKHRKTKVK